MKVRRIHISVLILLCLAISARSQNVATGTTPVAAAPIYTGIVVDCSGSQRLQMDRVVSLIKQFVEAMQDGDEAFVARYVDPARTSVVQEFTREKSDLNDAAEGLYVEGGQTSMLDAIEYAARYLAKSKPAANGGPPTLILISSGEDKSSSNTVDQTLSLLKEKRIQVYAIGLSDLKVSSKVLEHLSKGTGGKMYVPRTIADLSNAVLDITKSMRGAAVGK